MGKKLSVLLVIMSMAVATAIAQNAEDKAKAAASKGVTATKSAANKTADTAKGAVKGGKEAAKKPAAVKIVKGPVVEWTGEKTAVIAWSTNVRSSTTLHYGTDPNALTQTAKAPYGGPTHRVKLANLTPSTKYYYTLEDDKAQGTGTDAKSQVYDFTTVAKGQKGKRYTFVKTKE
jgi:hypothetical protein